MMATRNTAEGCSKGWLSLSSVMDVIPPPLTSEMKVSVRSAVKPATFSLFSSPDIKRGRGSLLTQTIMAFCFLAQQLCWQNSNTKLGGSKLGGLLGVFCTSPLLSRAESTTELARGSGFHRLCEIAFSKGKAWEETHHFPFYVPQTISTFPKSLTFKKCTCGQGKFTFHFRHGLEDHVTVCYSRFFHTCQTSKQRTSLNSSGENTETQKEVLLLSALSVWLHNCTDPAVITSFLVISEEKGWDSFTCQWYADDTPAFLFV